jgi:hypothetical protein
VGLQRVVCGGLWRMLNGPTTKGDFVATVEGGFTVNRARVKDSVGTA